MYCVLTFLLRQPLQILRLVCHDSFELQLANYFLIFNLFNDFVASQSVPFTYWITQSMFNPLNTKRRLLYLKTQFVPRSKHFSSRL